MVDIETIRKKAAELNLNLTQLEEKAGVANGVIGKWKTSSPNIDTLQKVARVLKCPLEELLLN